MTANVFIVEDGLENQAKSFPRTNISHWICWSQVLPHIDGCRHKFSRYKRRHKSQIFHKPANMHYLTIRLRHSSRLKTCRPPQFEGACMDVGAPRSIIGLNQTKAYCRELESNLNGHNPGTHTLLGLIIQKQLVTCVLYSLPETDN